MRLKSLHAPHFTLHSFPLWGGWEGLLEETVLENDDGFWSHVEDEVNDAQIGQKTMFGGEYLIVGCGTERSIEREVLLGGDDVAKISDSIGRNNCFLLVLSGALQPRMNVDEFAAFRYQCFVEIEQIVMFFLVERTKVVLIVFEERTIEIAGTESLPMLVSPVAVFADAEVADESASVGWLLHRNGEQQWSCR